MKDNHCPDGKELFYKYETYQFPYRSILVCKSHHLQNGLTGFWNGIAIHGCSNQSKVMPMSFSIAQLKIAVHSWQIFNSFGISYAFFGGKTSNELLHRHLHHLLCIEIICLYLNEALQGKKAIRF